MTDPLVWFEAPRVMVSSFLDTFPTGEALDPLFGTM